MNKIIFHGSHNQGLHVLNSNVSRFKGKVFGTYSFQRALTYCVNSENRGSGVLTSQSRLYVLDCDPEKVLNDFGSIYLLDGSLFDKDLHKGKQNDWVYSTTSEQEVIFEIKLQNLLTYWIANNVFAISPKYHSKLKDSSEIEGLLASIRKENYSLLTNPSPTTPSPDPSYQYSLHE